MAAVRTAVAALDGPAPTTRIDLLPNQAAHARRLTEILQERAFAMDLSAMGAGKTYTASSIAIDPALGFRHVIVIAPVSVQPKWEHMRKTHGVPVVANVSFCALRSIRGSQPKHGLQTRTDRTVTMATKGGADRQVNKADFRPTDRLRTIISQGVLLVVDEIQNIKNVSSQFSACQAIIRPISAALRARPHLSEQQQQQCRSRVLLLSGSPIDKQEQVVTLFRCFGVMPQDELCRYNPGTHVLEWRGMTDIVAFCQALDPRTTDVLMTQHLMHQDLRRTCYRLFQDVVKRTMSAAMSAPANPFAIEMRNAFYDVHDPQEKAALTRAVRSLSTAVLYDDQTDRVDLVAAGAGTLGGALPALASAMMAIETAKLGTFERVARYKLLSLCKVVVCVNYSSSIRHLQEALKEYDPVVLHGGMSAQQRATALERFQRPDGVYRLMVANQSVCSTGIDLDDKHGGFPRFCITSPNYAVITLYQLSYRFLRMNTRSDAQLHLVFGKHCHELGVLNAMARKSSVLKETTGDQQVGTVFPGDFQRFDEQSDFHVRWSAAEAIKKRWLVCYYDPAHPICRRRMARQFEELTTA